MSDPLDRVERLAEAARREQAPTVNVTARVVAALSAGPAEDDRPFNWLAAAAVAAAVVLALSLWPLAREWSDPMVAMFTGLSWGLL